MFVGIVSLLLKAVLPTGVSKRESIRRAFILRIDDAHSRRIKLWGTRCPVEDNQSLLDQLRDLFYPGRVERCCRLISKHGMFIVLSISPIAVPGVRLLRSSNNGRRRLQSWKPDWRLLNRNGKIPKDVVQPFPSEGNILQMLCHGFFRMPLFAGGSKGTIEMPMDERTVRRLENELEEAIGEAFGRMGSRKPALRPTGHTIHMMAKAAVAVYEAVVEDNDPKQRDD